MPVRLTSDGGPQFKSSTFKTFCDEWGIKHDPSSPYHHQANGAAEAAVKSVKSLITKCSPSGNLQVDAFRKGIIEFRNTPRANGLSPAQMVFGQPMRSHVMMHYRAFKREWQIQQEDADRKAVTLRAKAKERYDARAKELPKLSVGSVVRVQHPISKRWTEIAEVIGVDKRGRSYFVKTEGGRVYWRNRRFLRVFFPKP